MTENLPIKALLPDRGLDPTPILEAEFTYIAGTAFQANEERANVSTFYLVTAGSLIAALLSFQFESLRSPVLFFAFAGLFFLLAINGLITVIQLAKLRLAWFSSARALNRIKAYAGAHTELKDLAEAFSWNDETLPARHDRRSVGFLMALQVALFGAASLTAGVAFIFLGLSYSAGWIWFASASFGFIYLLVEMLSYRRLLT